MSHSIDTSAIILALNSAVRREQEHRGSSFNLQDVLDGIMDGLRAGVACSWQADEERDDSAAAAVGAAVAATLGDRQTSISYEAPSQDPPQTLSSPPSHLAMHGSLPAALYPHILRYLDGGIGNVDLRSCRSADRFLRSLVDGEPHFWTPVDLRGDVAVLNTGFFSDHAGSGPIDVSLYLTSADHHAPDGPLAQVAARMAHIGTLTIVAERAIPVAALLNLFSQGAPHLSALSIEGVVVGKVAAPPSLGGHPKLRRLRTTVSCMRALGRAYLSDLRVGITKLEVVAAVMKGTISLDEIFDSFCGLQSLVVAASCLEQSLRIAEHVPAHVEIVEGGTSASLPPGQLAAALAPVRPNNTRRLVVRGASATTIKFFLKNNLLHRATILPGHLALWVGFERARVFPEADPGVIAEFVVQMDRNTLSSLAIARSLRVDVIQSLAKGQFRRLRVLSVYVGATPYEGLTGGEMGDVLIGRRLWRCPKLRELRFVARLEGGKASPSKAAPTVTVKAAQVVSFARNPLRYSAIELIRFVGVQLAEGMEGPHVAEIHGLVDEIVFQ